MSGKHKGYHANPQKASQKERARKAVSRFENGARDMAKAAELLKALVDEIGDAELTAEFNAGFEHMASSVTEYGTIVRDLTGRLREREDK